MAYVSMQHNKLRVEIKNFHVSKLLTMLMVIVYLFFFFSYILSCLVYFDWKMVFIYC